MRVSHFFSLQTYLFLQIEMLTYLSGVTQGPVQKVEILINIITVTFDMNQPTQASQEHACPEPTNALYPLVCWSLLALRHALGLLAASCQPPTSMQNAMTVPNWNRCGQTMFDIMVRLIMRLHACKSTRASPQKEIHLLSMQSLLDENRHISLTDTPPEEEREEEPEPGTPTQAGIPFCTPCFLLSCCREWGGGMLLSQVRGINATIHVLPALFRCLQVWGNLGAFLERLDDEWNGSLKVSWLWYCELLPPGFLWY